MDFYAQLKSFKEEHSLSYDELGAHIGMKGNTFRMAIKRESFSDLEKQTLHETLFDNALYTLEDVSPAVRQQLREVSQFFAQYKELALQDPKISKIIDKEVARRLFSIASNKEALEKFLKG